MDLTLDHRTLEEAHETRRYFAKFERIIQHLKGVADSIVSGDTALSSEIPVLQVYLDGLARTFTALSYKYLLAGRVSDKLPKLLNIDRQDSGFPVYQEILEMANDAMQAATHLKSLPDMKELKAAMVRHILQEQTVPLNLQFAASERHYYDLLAKDGLFWARNTPRIGWTGNVGTERRGYRLHWAVYDSQQNIPIIYVLDLEDSGRIPLAKDERRWPRAQSHLVAQSSASLKLVTIARGFDRDFDNLHPKRLRRFFVGPMYSHVFTQQTGPLRDVLSQAGGKPGDDWAFAWTTETLVASGSEFESSGFFSSVERQIYQLDPFDLAAGSEQESVGHTTQQRFILLPQRPYQILQELSPPGFADIRKYAVSPSGRILSYK
ncbi:hypothetical protein FMN50_27260 [Rhodobacterales bacterium]|nr:hypothetical protein FMN50_27260 [Rhodobacterales bacterium]